MVAVATITRQVNIKTRLFSDYQKNSLVFILWAFLVEEIVFLLLIQAIHLDEYRNLWVEVASVNIRTILTARLHIALNRLLELALT